MLIDDVTVRISGGKGGDGIVGFSKTRLNLGPTGGNGGPGGDVYLEGVNDISALQQFKFTKEVKAPDGGVGTTRLNDGPRGEDLIVKIPVGTVFTNLTTGEVREITNAGEQIMVAHGGYRGRGNFHFRASTNTSPKEFEFGKDGESFEFRFELKMIADVGLVGLPNAGKSSLLNALTGAHSKVGNYSFTTLEPHLGAYYGLILADVPGLIEGASEGKGLGDKFLRHIERTREIFHLVSVESDDVVRDYNVIRSELEKYNPELATKGEQLILSKADMVSEKEVKEKLAKLKKLNKNVISLSIIDDASLDQVKKILTAISARKEV